MRSGYKKKEFKKTMHWLKVGSWILGLALFLFVGLFFLTIWMENKLERMVAQQSNGIYKLSLHGLQLSPFIGNLSADSLHLVPDYDRWQQLHEQDKATSPTLLDLKSRSLELNNLNYLAILFGSEATLDKLLINSPAILLTRMREDTTSQQEPLHQTVPDRLKGLQIGLISLENGKISYRDKPDTASTVFSVQQFHLTVEDVKLDSQSFHAPSKAYYASNIELDAAHTNYLQPNGLYRLTVDTVLLNTGKRILQAKQLQYKPTSDAAGLARAKGEATTHMSLEIPAMEFTGVNYPAHSSSNQVIVQHVLFQGFSLHAFKDKKNFDNKTARSLPHEFAQQMEVKFLIDTVEMRKGYIRYEEIVQEAVERGHITLEDMEVKITNLSNMPAHISMEKPAVVEGKGLVMGKVPARLTAKLPLLNKDGYHTLHGEVDAADPKILNPMVAPTAFMRIKSGQIRRGSIDLELSNEQANGTFHLIYHNFEVDLLSKGTGGNQSLGKKILTKMANWIAVKESNPGSKDEKPRVGEVKVKRSKQSSIFSYWTDCILDGFMDIATIK